MTDPTTPLAAQFSEPPADQPTTDLEKALVSTEDTSKGFFEKLDDDARKWFNEVARLLGHPLPEKSDDKD